MIKLTEMFEVMMWLFGDSLAVEKSTCDPVPEDREVWRSLLRFGSNPASVQVVKKS